MSSILELQKQSNDLTAQLLYADGEETYQRIEQELNRVNRDLAIEEAKIRVQERDTTEAEHNAALARQEERLSRIAGGRKKAAEIERNIFKAVTDLYVQHRALRELLTELDPVAAEAKVEANNLGLEKPEPLKLTVFSARMSGDPILDLGSIINKFTQHAREYEGALHLGKIKKLHLPNLHLLVTTGQLRIGDDGRPFEY